LGKDFAVQATVKPAASIWGNQPD